MQGIEDLAEMAPCHHFAEQALSILRYLAKKWNVDVDIPQRKGVSASAPDADADADADEDVDANIRSATSSLNFFVPKVVETDFICDWGGPGAQSYKTSTTTAAAPHLSRPPPQMGGSGGGAGPISNESVDSRMSGMEDVEGTGPGSGAHQSAQNLGRSRNQNRGRDPIAAAAADAASQPQAVGSRVAAAMEPLANSDEDGGDESGAKSFENPLFWPFPMQGRPMLPEGPLLREAGFEPL